MTVAVSYSIIAITRSIIADVPVLLRDVGFWA